MSIKIMQEVWEHAPGGQGTLLVLLALADSADEKSRECWPAVSTLADRARLKPRQVQNCLRALEDDGVLHVEPNAGRSGTNLYRIKPVSEWGGAKIAGGALECRGGVQPSAPGGVQPSAPEPSYRTVNEPSDSAREQSSLFLSIEQPESKVSTSEAFEELWNKYPKEGRKDKAAAKKKFAAVVKSGVDPAKIVSAAEIYARWLKGGAPGEFRPQAKHLTTWLNKGSYEDEIDAPPPVSAPERWYEDQIER